MKRILTRSQYLENLKNTQYDNITRVNEALENDTKWGDSLLGRLIFSTIRSAKSGYKTKKIEGILKDLQTQLDIIISASLTRDSADIFNKTYIKSTLEEIKNVCLSTESDEKKLEQLIGWDGRQYMWDPAGQKTINPDSPGRRIDGVDNIMQNIIDRITENLPNLESLFGMSRNAILDSLSDFTIELRKLTVELLGGTPGGNTTTIRSFPDIFGKAKEKIKALQDAYIFHKSYYEFLRESENANEKKIKDLKEWFDDIENDRFKTAAEFTKSEEYKKFKNIFDNLSQVDKEKLKDEDIKEFMEEIKKNSQEVGKKAQGESEGEGEGDSTNPNEVFYKTSKDFLQSIVDLHNMIKSNVVRFGGGKEAFENKVISAKSKLKVGNEYMYINVEGEKKRCLLLSKETEIKKSEDKKWLTEDDIKGDKLPNDRVWVVLIQKGQKYDGRESYNKVGTGNSVEALKIYNLDGKSPESKVEKPGEDVSTSFNKDKYDNIQKSLVGNKNPSEFSKILVNSMKMEQEAIKIAQKKSDNKNVEIYKKKLNDNLKKLINIQANSYGISKEKKDKSGKAIGYKNIEDLKKEISTISKQKWSVDLPLGKSTGSESGNREISGNVKIDKASYSFLYEEAEANLQKDETQAKNAWKKVINAYEESGIKNFIPQIEELLKTSSKDIKTICKQVVLNKSTTGKPISFEELIKEAVNVNDVAKSISLFGRILLSFKEDMGLTGSYGSAISPLKKFVNSFFELEKLFTDKTTLNSISGKSSNESYRYYSFDELIREQQLPPGVPPPGPPGPPGPAPGPAPGPGAGPTPRTVESIWKDFFEKEDKKEPFRLTQREIEELKRGDKLKVDDLFLDVKKNPDPILALVRIWTRAHNLYFTKLIPSGRSSGVVTQATYLKYVHLGGGGTGDSPGSPDQPGVNWALKSAWDKWTDGVLKILQDQKYRKVLANIKFKVAGAEDSFNKVVGESVKFIVEELETDTRTAREDGRNLFKFMNDLLEPETAGKFETERKKLLNLYFGIDAKEGSLGKLQSSNPVNNEPRKDDIEANSLVWKPFRDLNETKKFNDFGHAQSEKGSYFALPLQVKDGSKPSMLFFIVIDKIVINGKLCNVIKFVFGDEEKLIGKSIKEHDNKKYENHKYPNWKIQGTNDGNKLHLGIIHMDDKYKYHLVHKDVTSTGSSTQYKEYKEESNISNMAPSKMVEYDSTKKEQEFNILEIKIDGNNNVALKRHLGDLEKEMEKVLK